MSDEPTREDVEALCEMFHDAYEAAAVEQGWETQQRSRVPWAEVPEANKETMRATIRAVMPGIVERVRAGGHDRVVGYLRELRDAADMPMHHQADIDQFLVEVLGVWK